MDIYLIDGTYELFRHYFAVPSARDRDGREVGAVRGVVTSLLGMMTAGTTHIGVATDHVIESFRNQMWPGYKTGEGIEPDLLAQFPLLEDTLYALGVAVWPMVEYEADDALASAAAKAAADPRVERVLICTPDKDLAQCVRGTRIVQMDRRARTTRDEAGVIAKFGVPPASIPDYLALVGDSADGFPGPARLGRQVRGGGAGEVRTPGGHSHRLGHVGRERVQALGPGRHPAARARQGAPVSRPGHPEGRRGAVRQRGRTAVEGPDAGLRRVRRAIRQGGEGGSRLPRL